MSKRFKIYLLFFIYPYFLDSCRQSPSDIGIVEESSQAYLGKRMAAEWEPAIGAIISWPLDIPHKLVIELAKDGRLFTMVPDEKGKLEAISWYSKWNIDLDKVTFIVAPQGWDSWWVRDWGPFSVYSPEDNMMLADGQYEYSTPITGLNCEDELTHIFTEKDSAGNEKILLTTLDDEAPRRIGSQMNIGVLDLPFTFTGGNVFTDGRGTVLSTCIIKNENRFIGGSDESLIEGAEKFLGIQNFYFISNFEKRGIQHIDCFLKMLDEERLLVARTPNDHPLYDIYEDIVQNELSVLKNIYGRPYTILRLDTDRYHEDALAAYTNSLILNKTVYVPLFGIDQDSMALSQWTDAMPGYTVKGFEYKVDEEPILHASVKERRALGFGWDDGDALHCRTRAMWDPEMLYMSIDRVPEQGSDNHEYRVHAVIIDYSKKGLVQDELQCHWREKGSSEWKSVPLQKDSPEHTFYAVVPNPGNESAIEYFFIAKSKSGRIETMPRTAPEGYYEL